MQETPFISCRRVFRNWWDPIRLPRWWIFSYSVYSVRKWSWNGLEVRYFEYWLLGSWIRKSTSQNTRVIVCEELFVFVSSFAYKWQVSTPEKRFLMCFFQRTQVSSSPGSSSKLALLPHLSKWPHQNFFVCRTLLFLSWSLFLSATMLRLLYERGGQFLWGNKRWQKTAADKEKQFL